ncbi:MULTISPECIES: helix-turn-helix domain-containing protein [Pseudomonas]|jgi:ribosome-binding protein aMBF1 (putative translation factor)|uniref:Helix-turn-helix transcriptional regulator n=1 Tax=Pseudomonas mosselii TaxID=78327 RepID=A0A5R8Z7X3_9PSED|nr:helix-turn-helix transcriptional regulator [Pseudomonas mosselii]TLP61227.1 helix-turn-helix transcriptional regulator [Pseudomonas mosselii]
MGIQVISRDGQPEYAVVPWAQYQALLAAAGQAPAQASAEAVTSPVEEAPASLSSLADLAALRQAKGMDAQLLARNVGISPAYLAMIESGERRPDAAILRALAWHLGVAGWSEPS